jgi:predicted RNase H-like nuclease (RuvC/YqgF family)
MNTRCRLLTLAAAAFFLSAPANAQDSQSLGEVARQQRLHKGQPTSAPVKDAAESKVITNEEIPEHTEDKPGPPLMNSKNLGLGSPAPKGSKQTAENWKSRIQEQKGQIVSLQRRMDEINSSIRFSSFDCGANCERRNQRQRSKQQQVEQMQGQLQEQKRTLETMQNTARKQGYGSSVYDP